MKCQISLFVTRKVQKEKFRIIWENNNGAVRVGIGNRTCGGWKLVVLRN